MRLRRFRFLPVTVLIGLLFFASCGPPARLERDYSTGEAALRAGEETDAIEFFSEVCIEDPAYKDACQQLATILDDSLVLVPAGEFLMGNDDTRPSEAPQRSVYLDAYKIQTYEITNVQYQQFVRNTEQAADAPANRGGMGEGRARG
jgi:formylglycine-generating enzyme required for sulfatase activity